MCHAFMTSFNYTNHVNQHKKFHMGAKPTTWVNALFNLTTMLVFLFITYITYFDVSHNKHY